MTKIGFIGVGVMGKSMVRNLMSHGYEVSIYTRTKSKAEDIIREGARWCDSTAECAEGKDVVITIVGFPRDVEEVYFGENGILAHIPVGSTVIDMTTTSPKLSQRIYAEAKERGIKALDAPVSGGDTGAQKGTLTIMVGGDKDAFDASLPVLSAMGTNIVYEGTCGMGQHTKMANQIALAGSLIGTAEAIAYGRKVGLDPKVMLDTISTGAAGSWQMSNNGFKILEGDFAPGFFVSHYVKDMKIAMEEADAVSLSLPVLREVLGLFEKLEKEGGGRLGTQAIIKMYEE